MRRILSISIVVLLLVQMLACSALGVDTDWQQLNKDTVKAFSKLQGCSVRKLLQDGSVLSPGDSVSDWIVMSMALSGIELDYSTYLNGMRHYVEVKYNREGLLDPYRATEWHRIILTVLSLGGDPYAFGSTADGNSINLVADGTYSYVHGDVGFQGLNGTIYALIAMDAANCHTPEAEIARELWISQIFDAQSENGGFGLTSGSSDIDITAMALQALGPYQDRNTDAISAAMDFLSRNQDPDGGFSTGGKSSCESVGQVSAALCAVDERDRLVKPKGTPVDALLSFRLPSGLYAHDKNGEADTMATSQAMLAVAAQYRMQQEHCWVFDFSHYEVPDASGRSVYFPALLVSVILLGGFILTIRRRSKR